jgi:hypothetical protein
MLPRPLPAPVTTQTFPSILRLASVRLVCFPWPGPWTSCPGSSSDHFCERTSAGVGCFGLIILIGGGGIKAAKFGLVLDHLVAKARVGAKEEVRIARNIVDRTGVMDKTGVNGVDGDGECKTGRR